MLAFLIWVQSLDSRANLVRCKKFTWAAATALVVLGLSAGLLTGCNKGVAAGMNGGPPGTTPAGTYNITVTGKSSTDAHSFVVTMTVQ